MAGAWIGSAVYRLREGFVAVDAAMAQALGYTAEEMAGRAGSAFTFFVEPQFRREVTDYLQTGVACRATTCYRHGVSGEPLWITGELAPMAPSSPSLILVTLLEINESGTSSVEPLPGSLSPTDRLRALDLDLGMMLHQQLSELRESLRRRDAMRAAVQAALHRLLTEERTSTTLEERLAEVEERVDRLVALIAGGLVSGGDASTA